MTANPVEQLRLALDGTGGLVSGVRAGQWDGPTPCPEMTVRDLVVHMVAGNYVFAEIMGGTPLPQARAAAGKVTPDGDLAAQFRDAADLVAGAFGQPGALEREVVIPAGAMPGIGALHIRVIEMLVHGWDLARATGQPASFPDDLAEAEIAFARRALEALPADRRPFDPPQPVADDAPGIDRLAALLGREVPA
jgi:uncharacterized protein (TIGR03086 family)